MHCEHTFGSKYLVFHRIIPRPLRPKWRRVILTHGNHFSLWLITRQVFLRPAPGRTIFWRRAARASQLALSLCPLPPLSPLLSYVMLICIKGKEKTKQKVLYPPVNERRKTPFVLAALSKNGLFKLLTLEF